MKWGFIYTLDDVATEPRIDRLGDLVCIGARRVEDAPDIARQLLAEGVEMIELCGGFGAAGLAAVISAVNGRVPVGAVFYGVEASAGLQRLFGGAAAQERSAIRP